jgi:hypothetical protein
LIQSIPTYGEVGLGTFRIRKNIISCSNSHFLQEIVQIGGLSTGNGFSNGFHTHLVAIFVMKLPYMYGHLMWGLTGSTIFNFLPKKLFPAQEMAKN